MTATTPTATPSSIGGFAVLPLRYSSSATALHNLYVRAHAGTRPANLPEGRTLFVVNVPPDASARELGALFTRYGAVERVVFGSSSGLQDQEDQDEDEQENEQQQADEEEANSNSSSSSSSEDDATHPRKKRKLDKKNGSSKNDANPKTKAKPKPSGPPALVPLPSRVTRELRPSGGSAHVVFLDGSSLQRALSPVSLSAVQAKPPAWPPKLPNSTTSSSHPSTEEPSGLAYYAARHAAARPPLDAVLQHAESAILRFDFALAAAKREQKSKYRKGEEVVDEDGFTLVVRGGAYGQSVGGGVGVASKKFELAVGGGGGGKDGEGKDGGAKRGKGRKKKERKEKEGFYAFQVRERNLKEHAELRKKFEEDKRRVEELQKKRAFVPY